MRQVLLRLPDEVYDRTKAKAEREHRSLNAQIVHVLDGDTAPPQVVHHLNGDPRDNRPENLELRDAE